MARVTLTSLTSLENETSALTAINNNFTAIAAALELLVSRTGQSPNTLTDSLDMNGERIINVGAPTQSADAVRKQDLDDLGLITTDEMTAIIDRLDSLDTQETVVEGYKDAAAASAAAAAASALESAAYVGAATSAPSWTTARDLTFTGDVTGSITGLDGTANKSTALSIAANAVGTSEIADDAVTNAKLAPVATQTFKGRTTASTGDVEDLTATQATAILNVMVGDSGSGGTKGLVPAPASGDAAANKYLKADGTWHDPTMVPDLSDLDTTEKSLATTGSMQIGPLILKWGTHTGASSSQGSTTLTFASAFPNACLKVLATPRNSNVGPSDQDAFWQIISYNTNGVVFYHQNGNGGVIPQADWLAIGY